MTRKIKRGGKVWINIFPRQAGHDRSRPRRAWAPARSSPEHWVAVVKPGRVHVRAGSRRAGAARAQALRLAGHQAVGAET